MSAPIFLDERLFTVYELINNQWRMVSDVWIDAESGKVTIARLSTYSQAVGWYTFQPTSREVIWRTWKHGFPLPSF